MLDNANVLPNPSVDGEVAEAFLFVVRTGEVAGLPDFRIEAFGGNLEKVLMAGLDLFDLKDEHRFFLLVVLDNDVIDGQGPARVDYDLAVFGSRFFADPP